MQNKSTQTSHSPHSTGNPLLLHALSRFAGPLLVVFLTACSTTQHQNAPNPTSTIVALVNTHPITTTDLYPHLAEIAGHQILSELVLTHLLNTIASDNHWTITDTNIQIEINNLITTIDQSSTPTNTPRLIQTIRHRRGLGPTRFNALLRRNAILRKLITNDPTLPAQIQLQIQTATNQLTSPPTPDQLKTITHRAALVAQQQAMESYAQTLLNQNEVLVMDRALKWSRE